MSCLGTWSSSRTLPLAGRGDINTGCSRGWQWENATLLSTLLQPRLGNEPLPCCCWAHITLSLLEPKEGAEGMDQGQAARGMLTARESPSCSHGAPSALAGGVLRPWKELRPRKELSPSQSCGEQPGTPWGWEAQPKGQLRAIDPGHLQTHPVSPGCQDNSLTSLPVHPKPSGSSPVGQRRDVFPGALLLTLPRLSAPSPPHAPRRTSVRFTAWQRGRG